MIFMLVMSQLIDKGFPVREASVLILVCFVEVGRFIIHGASSAVRLLTGRPTNHTTN